MSNKDTDRSIAKTRADERKAIIQDIKDELEEEMVLDAGAQALLVAPPEINIELTVFTIEDIEQAMPTRDWNHEALKWTKSICAAVLNHIVNYGVIRHACLSQGVRYRGFEEIVKQYPAFEDLKSEAQGLYRDKVSRAVHNRAIVGWLEPQFHKGQFCGYIRKFSDRMLELQAKRYNPEYRDKSAVDLNVAGGVLVINPNAISDKEAWLEEHRKRRQIESTVVEPTE